MWSVTLRTHTNDATVIVKRHRATGLTPFYRNQTSQRSGSHSSLLSQSNVTGLLTRARRSIIVKRQRATGLPPYHHSQTSKGYWPTTLISQSNVEGLLAYHLAIIFKCHRVTGVKLTLYKLCTFPVRICIPGEDVCSRWGWITDE